MNKLNIKKSSIALLLAMSTLYGCSGDDPVAEDIPARLTPRDFTSADIVGQSVKGTMSNADVTVQQMNGAPISITSERQTDGTGSVTLKVRGNDGFGIDSMFKITVTADSDTQMMCDAITCAGVDLGEVLSGSPLVGSSLTTLAYVNVPYANSSDGNADATFQASALTTVATQLIENAVAGGKNVSVRALYELALQEYSELTLKAIGVFSPGANVFQTELISAESYQNFVVDQACEDVPLVDDEGNPILDDEGTPVLDDEGNPILDDDAEPVL
ncbi:MAG: coagulation factor 5/8 type protein, partial [Paraglaciecola sp.]|nr:coagulation factor 5/8 type protein [Paraglaciecola sp.]